MMALALLAAREAEHVDLAEIAERNPGAEDTLNCWPGEHYRLLSGLVRTLRPRCVVEVGTATGMSALALAEGLEVGARVVTFDILPWDAIPETLLRDSDFSVIEQRVCDLSDPEVFASNADVLHTADLMFVDGPKDGRFEPLLHRRLLEILKPRTIVVYDDIRLLTMVELWRSIKEPKFDATSLGHWTGTGLVRY
jgi:predicted O-methyltransferase YrrM